MLLHEMLERAVRLYRHEPALVDGAVRMTYLELHRRVHRLAAAMQGLGLEHGDHLAVLAPNSFRYMETYLAAALAGLVVSPINTRLSAPETRFILNDGEIKALFIGRVFLPLLGAMGAGGDTGLTTVQHTVLMEEALEDGEDEGLLGYEALLDGGDPAALKPRQWRDDDMAHLFYTGGTTGLPKGVMLSQRNVVANIQHAIQIAEFSERDVWLHAAPMFHLADSWTSFAMTLLGAFHVFMNGFDPARSLALIQEHKITSTLWVPTMINAVLALPNLGDHDVSSMRRLLYGASPMPPERLRSAIALFGNVLQQLYGQTESAPFLTASTLRGTRPDGNETDIRRLASCGQEIVGVEVRVVNSAGEPVQLGEVGELTARGPNIMLGYWKRPQETAETLRDGWLYTGDLATVDEDGWVFIVDRAKDMIITGGENVYSTEVENALYQHPAVLEAAVIGVPDDAWGEAIKAAVVLRNGQGATEQQLIAHCRKLIASFKCPRSIDFLAALPKSGAGKILKSDLRKPYWAGQTRQVH